MILWIPILVASSILAAYFSFKSSLTKEIHWTIWLAMLNIIPLWAVIARYSKNILVDGLVYDILLTVVYTVAILYFTSGQVSLSMLQWVSVGIIILGLIAFKLGAV